MRCHISFQVAGYPSTRVQCLMRAISEDGIHWRKTDQPLLIRAEDSTTPDPEPDRIGDFHRPSLLWQDGKYHHQYDRIRAMRRPVANSRPNNEEK